MTVEMTIQDRLVEVAYKWLDAQTPYIQGANRIGMGVDCGNLLVEAGKEIGKIPKSFRLPYIYKDWHRGKAKNINKTLFRDLILKFADPIERAERIAGDIISFTYCRIESHVAILVDDDCIIHAASCQGVKKQRLKNYKNINTVYRIRS